MSLRPSLPPNCLQPISTRTWHCLQPPGSPRCHTHSLFSVLKFCEASRLNISIPSLPSHSSDLRIWLPRVHTTEATLENLPDSFLPHGMCVFHLLSYLISLQFDTVGYPKHSLSLVSGTLYSTYPLNCLTIHSFLHLGPSFSMLPTSLVDLILSCEAANVFMPPNPAPLFLCNRPRLQSFILNDLQIALGCLLIQYS